MGENMSEVNRVLTGAGRLHLGSVRMAVEKSPKKWQLLGVGNASAWMSQTTRPVSRSWVLQCVPYVNRRQHFGFFRGLEK